MGADEESDETQYSFIKLNNKNDLGEEMKFHVVSRHRKTCLSL